MIISSDKELNILREGGRRLAKILSELQRAPRPGVNTLELDRLAERLIADAGGTPVFKGYRSQPTDRPFPASICTSINDEVVHGIPAKDRILRAGDLLGIDAGMRYPARDGLVTDMAVSVGVGKISPLAEQLLVVTKAALSRGIRVIKAGMRMGDLGAAIQEEIESQGFSVVRDLVGHGVGKNLHEHPYVPNYGTPGDGIPLRADMVLAIEPMATRGDSALVLDADGWTWRTKDGSLAAHFEHTVVVTKDGAEVLTQGA